jgi:hypothetical protein
MYVNKRRYKQMMEYWVLDKIANDGKEIPMWGYNFADACRRHNRNPEDFIILNADYID